MIQNNEQVHSFTTEISLRIIDRACSPKLYGSCYLRQESSTEQFFTRWKQNSIKLLPIELSSIGTAILLVINYIVDCEISRR